MFKFLMSLVASFVLVAAGGGKCASNVRCVLVGR